MQLKFSSLNMIPLLGGMLFAPISLAQAGTLTFTQQFDFQTTNFLETLTLNKFDSNLGRLQSIELEFTGQILGNMGIENLGSSSSQVTANLSSDLQFRLPDNTLLAALNPSVSVTETLSAFDGIIDFQGNSGQSWEGVSATTSQTLRIEAPRESDLALFTANGGGNLDFSIAGLGSSWATGSGNVIQNFQTLAAAGIRVSYEFTDTEAKKVPEPTGAIAIAIVGGLGVFSKRKHKGVSVISDTPR